MWEIILRNEEVIIKLLLAVIVGGFTGYEREKSNQFAGFRTHILVSIGSCITSIIALELFNNYSNISTMDPARLPAQVLSGIGFLGAGAILKNSNGIRGLTTAAGIWATACIGIAIGYGQYVLGIETQKNRFARSTPTPPLVRFRAIARFRAQSDSMRQ